MDSSRAPERPRPRLTVIGVIGELLLTAGVICLLFVGWQVWFNDLVVGAQQQDSARQLAEQWANEDDTVDETDETGEPALPENTATPVEPVNYGDPVVATAAADGKAFATLYVPRFGADYIRVIGEGVDMASVLNNSKLGVGRYPGTQMPGEVGNFALAAHRTTWGAPFKQIADLQVGDKIYVQTQDGWYTYGFRNLEYVWPSGVGVLEPVPQAPGSPPMDRIITLTSCNPLFSAAERIIAYGVYESWQPASAGMPAELAKLQADEA